MNQNDMESICIFNKFKTTFHTHIDINMLKNTCLKTPPNDSKISHLFNTNKSTYNAHNDLVFQKIYICQTFILKAIDIARGSMPLTYHLPNDPNKTIT